MINFNNSKLVIGHSVSFYKTTIYYMQIIIKYDGEIKLNSLNILHISDAHIQLDAKEEVSEIVVKMINDALKVQKEQDIKK